MTKPARTYLTLSTDLLGEVDEVAGPRGPGRYTAEAVRQRLKRDRLRRAVDATAGILQGTDRELSRAEVSTWVDQLRTEARD